MQETGKTLAEDTGRDVFMADQNKSVKLVSFTSKGVASRGAPLKHRESDRRGSRCLGEKNGLTLIHSVLMHKAETFFSSQQSGAAHFILSP